ncbi:hypothetical protein [Psychrobacillus sp. L3]|uniref:hypothetical protein n=1 Tax=Psychrobacillus sp. L3 TaxID=3236891 RepID=UPI0036F2E26D
MSKTSIVRVYVKKYENTTLEFCHSPRLAENVLHPAPLTEKGGRLPYAGGA